MATHGLLTYRFTPILAHMLLRGFHTPSIDNGPPAKSSGNWSAMPPILQTQVRSVTLENEEVAYVMELIQLEDHLRLNIPEIDAQHENLIELVSRLHEALVGGADKAVRDSLLSQLLEGLQNHCAYEEDLMLRYGYPDYQAHKSEHDRLKRNVADLIARYRNGELILSIAVVMELKCWATIHIEKSDKPLGAFLIDQKGVEAVPD